MIRHLALAVLAAALAVVLAVGPAAAPASAHSGDGLTQPVIDEVSPLPPAGAVATPS